MLTTILAGLFDRDLSKLQEEIRAFDREELLWQALPGVTNTAGNLSLHLHGNLQHFVGTILGHTDYVRDRPKEFSAKGVPAADLLEATATTQRIVHEVITGLSEEVLAANYPVKVFDTDMSTGQFLTHLLTHLNYHLGQINYLRRILQQSTTTV